MNETNPPTTTTTTGSTTPTPTPTPPTTTSWRQEVPQSYRTKEANEIARVLASLEPDADTPPSTKLMLASQFENKMFNEASSLADYRKKIQRRLKKMQKNYRRSLPSGSSSGLGSASVGGTGVVVTGGQHTSGVGIGGIGGGGTVEVVEKSEREIRLQKEEIARLKRGMLDRHKEKLKMIVEKGHEACRIITEQHGIDKGERFSQHVDYALQWALDIGAVPDDGTVKKCNGTMVCWGTNWRSLDDEQSKLEKTAKDLESRLRNIWYYVLKATQIDKFVLERLKEVEEQLLRASSSSSSSADSNNNNNNADGSTTNSIDYQVASYQATRLLAIIAKENIELVPSSSTPTQTAQQQLAVLRSVVPIPHTPQEEKDACLAYLDKIRAACQVMLINVTLRPNETCLEGKNARMVLNGSIEKAYQSAVDAFDFLAERYKEVDFRPKRGTTGSSSNSSSGQESDIVLEDAWNRVMGYDKDVEMVEASDENVGGSIENNTETTTTTNNNNNNNTNNTSSSVQSSPKRTKKRAFPLVIRSTVLFRQGRNPPSHLINALRNKGAEIQRDDSPHAETTLVLRFGDAFAMTLHFSPLLVTVRALPPSMTTSSDGVSGGGVRVSEKECCSRERAVFRETVVDAGRSPWKSPYAHLDMSPVVGSDGRMMSTSRPALRVMGINGTYPVLAPLVSSRLSYASAQATRVLRRCFADIVGRAYDSKNSSEYEVEVLEGTAVLKFVSKARSLYGADWGKR